MRPLSVKSKLQDVANNATSAYFLNGHRVPPQSPWRSPVPYLFGGLAVMIGLISFALLILACSYLRLSSSGEEDGDDGGGRADDEEKEKQAKEAYEEKFIVIMAGDDLPRFLATPAMKKCTCGDHEGKMVISQENSVVLEEAKEAVETTSIH
ncbi:unnamed protein product [Cochlearia groenlandica]